MADAQAHLSVNLDTSKALASIRALQAEISKFHQTQSALNAQAASQAAGMQRNLINSINATGQFSAQMTTVASTTSAFTRALETNKLSLGQYFKYGVASTKTFGRVFRSEFDTINRVARERVKTLQTQYIKMGRDANGAMRAIAVRPLALDMENLATRTAIAAQRQALFNQLLRQGSTSLLNWGKNTQWAGRQLMVGFTLPLTLFGSVAARTFMDLEEQAIRFKRVYGELFTSQKETDQMYKDLQGLGSEFTKYGVALKDTMKMAADAAAMGKTGADLMAQVRQAATLAVLGGVEQDKALETTISLTNAFGVATEELANKIDFLNAVENQTVVSIEDLTTAIPKAGPVVKQLGGDVEDLAFFLTAMKEGGINASEGANALKSGLARIINPTDRASEMLAGLGININGIVEGNAGDVKGTIVELATALDTLDPLNKARAIEELFGKFQFARISTLMQNVIGEGTQAQRVLQLTQASTEELAILTERELKRVEDSPLYKFKQAFEDLKISLIPIGEAFLKAVTPIIEFGARLLDKFDAMNDGAKSFVVALVAGLGVIAPTLLMTVGLVGNGVANLIKFFSWMSQIGKSSANMTELGMSTQYMTQEQLEANAVASSLNQTHTTLRQTFTSEAAAVNALTLSYNKAIAAQRALLASGGGAKVARGAKPAGMATGGIVKKYAKGVTMVPGPKGAGDVVPAMLSPGEAVIPVEETKRYFPLIQAMIAGAIPGFANGFDGDYTKLAQHLAGRKTNITAMRDYLATSGLSKDFLNQLANSKAGSVTTKADLQKLTTSFMKSSGSMDFSHTRSATRISLSDASKFSGAAGARAQEMIKAGGTTETTNPRIYSSWGFMGDRDLNKASGSLGGANLSAYAAATKNVTPEQMWGRAFQAGGADIFGKDSPAMKAFGKAFQGEMDKAAKTFEKVFDTDARLNKALERNPALKATSLEDIERKAMQRLPAQYKAQVAGVQAKALQTPAPGATAVKFNPTAELRQQLAKLFPKESKYVRQGGSGKLVTGGMALGVNKSDRTLFGKLIAKDLNVREEAIAAQEEDTKVVRKGTEQKKDTGKKAVKASKASAKAAQTRVVDGREQVFRGGKWVDKVRSNAAQRANQERAARTQEADQKREARNARRRELYAQRKAAQQVPAPDAAEQRRAPGMGGGGRMGIGMAVSSAAIAASMAPGKVGEVGQSLIMPAIVASSLLMLPPKIMVVVGALSLAGFSIYKMVDAFKSASKEAMTLAEELGVGSKSMDRLSEFAGNVTASQIMNKRRAEGFAPYQIQPGKQTFGSAFLGSEAGTELKDSISKALESQDLQAVQQQIVNQMTTAIATGALNAAQARSIVYELGKELGDYSFAINVNGKLTQLIGPNGENLLNDPLGVRLEIMQESVDAVESSFEAIDASGVGARLGTKIGLGAAATVAGVWGGAAIGAKIGAAVGTAITPGIGTAIGVLAGAALGVGVTAAISVADFEKIGNLSGAAIANSVMLVQQRQDILDSLDIEYEKRIAAATAAGDTAEADRLTNQYLEERQQFLEQTGQAISDVASQIANAPSFLGLFGEKPAMLDALNDAIKMAYEDNPLAQMMAMGVQEQIKDIDFGATEREVTLSLLLASKDIDPAALSGFLATFGGDTATIDTFIDITTNLGGAEGGRVLQVMNLFEDDVNKTQFLADVKARGANAAGFLDAFQQIAQTAAGGQVDLQASLDFYLNNPELLQDYEQDMQRLRAQAAAGPISQDFIINYIGENVADIIATDQAYFDSLDPVQQVTYIQTVRTIYETYGENFRETPAFVSWRRSQPSSVPDEGFFTQSANQLTQAPALAPGGAEELAPEPQGGGSKDQSSILDDVLKKLRDYRDLQVGILKGWKNISTKLEELFGGDAGISGFRGLSQQMRDIGLGENFIEMIVGMSPEDYEKYKDSLFVFDDKGNLAGITTEARALAKALDAITLGEFQNEQESTLISMQKQVAAARKLVSAGLDWSQAYEMAADAGLAAAIVAEQNLNNIRELVNLVRQTERMTADQAAASAVATANSATANLRKVQEFIAKNSSALTDRQKEAILNDEDLQRLVLNPSINPEVLRQALRDAENAAQLDLEIKKMTFTGLQEIFTDGFGKAMEAFAAKEQQIDIDFQFSTASDQAIIQAAERQISDIRYLVDDLEADLTRIRYQEDEINKRYKDRLDALNEVADINEKLSAQQEAQLTVADALSRGDISAAARAAQEYRQQLAQDNATQQRDDLTRQKDIELAAVRGQMGMSRSQIEAQILEYQKQILEIEESQLEPAQQRVTLAERLKMDAIASLEILGKTRLEWEAVKNRVDLAVTSSEDYINAMREALGVVQDIVTYWDSIDNQSNKDLFVNVRMNTQEFDNLPIPLADGAQPLSDSSGSGSATPEPEPVVTPPASAVNVSTSRDSVSISSSLQEEEGAIEGWFNNLTNQGWFKSLQAIGIVFGQKVQEGFTNIGETIDQNIIQPIKDKWNEFATWVDTNVIQPIKNAWNWGVDWVNTTIVQPIQNGWNTLTSWVDTNIIQPIKDKWNWGVDWAYTTIVQPIEETLTTFFAWFTEDDTLENKISDVETFWDTSVTYVTEDLFPKIVTWFEELPEKLSSVFEKVGDGIANSVKIGINKAIDFINKFKITIPEKILGFTVPGGGKSFGFNIPRIQLNSGGVVPGIGNTDTVPAMLTPGEFVVRKFAVSRFGLENLKAINSGNYSSLSASKSSQSAAGSNSVYNYSLNLNVKSDSNPEDIARVVMSGIRQVENRRIRGNTL